MTKKTLITSIFSVGFIVLSLGCAGQLNLTDLDKVSSGQGILQSVAKESRDSLESVLKNTRLEVLNTHRKILLSSNKAERKKLRIKLKKERQVIHTKHSQLLAEYDIKSKKRINDLLLTGI